MAVRGVLKAFENENEQLYINCSYGSRASS